MADAKKTEAEEGEEPAPKKKKGKLMLFIIIGVVLLVLAGGGAFMLMKKSPAADEEGADGDGSAKTEKAKKVKKDGKEIPPVFVKLDSFTVRLQSEGGDSYLQTQPELRVLDALIGEKIKQYTPEIRHRMLLILSSKKPADVTNPQGVQMLSNEMRVAINAIVDGPKTSKSKKKVGDDNSGPPDNADPDDSVQAVLFTSFIVQ